MIVISGDSIMTVFHWIGVICWFTFAGGLFYATKVSHDDMDYEHIITFALGGTFTLAIGIFLLLLVTGQVMIK